MATFRRHRGHLGLDVNFASSELMQRGLTQAPGAPISGGLRPPSQPAQTASRLCRSEGEPWCSRMKITFNFNPSQFQVTFHNGKQTLEFVAAFFFSFFLL